MKNNYIINKGYSVKYDLKSLLLCYDYFNHGIKLPRYIDYIFMRKILHYILRIIIIIAYVLNLYKLKYKTIILDENSIVIFKGKGEWANTVRLLEVDGGLKIQKITFDKQTYLREKNFYKNNYLNFKLPKMYFKGNNIIEIEFLKVKSFQRLINDGSINLDNSIYHFNKIKKFFKLFYKNNHSLIHSDMSIENIFIKGNNYYLIDFSDSRIDDIQYDLYVLLRSIIFSFNHDKVNKQKNIYSLEKEKLSKLLKLNVEKIIQFENQFINLDIKKHPNHANTINKYCES
ncbi:phosphotransferase [Candidatus Roizmanbacteria bacterium]|nr:phosphotransferase [Candidatus Roizmanbacteria bacterium]